MKKTLCIVLIVLGLVTLVVAGFVFSMASCEAKADILGLAWQYNPLTGCWFDTDQGWFPLAHWVVR